MQSPSRPSRKISAMEDLSRQTPSLAAESENKIHLSGYCPP